MDADGLAEGRFVRQAGWRHRDTPAPWTNRVRFASGWGFDREDPTPVAMGAQ